MDKTFCIFGDSVTQAAYVKQSWVDLFREFVETKFSDTFVNVFNLGIGGNTSDDILKRFVSEANVRMPTDIIFAFGVNDSGYFRTPDSPIVSKDQFIGNVKKLIAKAQEITPNITFIEPILGDESLLKPFPGSSQGKSYELARVKEFSACLKEICHSYSCRFIPLLDLLEYSDFSDGLHPNQQGHLKMYVQIKKYF